MGIQVAAPHHVTAIHELLDRSRHLYVDFPESMLNELVLKQSAVVGDDAGTLWGFLYIEREPRPVTMPPLAPNRLYLRAIALANKRSPIKDIEQLLAAALTLPTVANTTLADTTLADTTLADNAAQDTERAADQIVFFSRESWPLKPLLASGFEVAETVDNFELNRLVRRWHNLKSEHAEFEAQQTISIRTAVSSDFDAIAELDGLAFDPHWHFSAEQLTDLATHHRVRVAVINDNPHSAPVNRKRNDSKIVGYTALSQIIRDMSGWRATHNMHLARIATHPTLQGKGIGRYLLLDVLKHAHSKNIDSVLLNTQTHNKRSQSLYKQYGFRLVGKSFTVLMMKLI